MSHTKGPWKLSKEWSRHFKISTDEMIVATVALQATGSVVNKANETAEANAKLIAASPELLKCLIMLDEGIREGLSIENNDPFHKIIKQCIEQATK